jgi:hypothetical protein
VNLCQLVQTTVSARERWVCGVAWCGVPFVPQILYIGCVGFVVAVMFQRRRILSRLAKVTFLVRVAPWILRHLQELHLHRLVFLVKRCVRPPGRSCLPGMAWRSAVTPIPYPPNCSRFPPPNYVHGVSWNPLPHPSAASIYTN